MKIVPLSSEGLRIGRPLPFSVRDGTGMVLLARGASIQTDKQLQLLRSRPLFIDMAESESVQRAYAGQLDQMLRQEVALGRIADARPDYESMPVPGRRPRPSARSTGPTCRCACDCCWWIRAAPGGSRACARCATTRWRSSSAATTGHCCG